jgi:hypothetical protein
MVRVILFCWSDVAECVDNESFKEGLSMEARFSFSLGIERVKSSKSHAEIIK